MYGLPKVHKPECPLRPIVSFIGSPTYHLQIYLVELLAPVTGKNGLCVQNSQEFVQLVRAQNLLPNEGMFSFHVVSLFTNVPNDVAIDVARERLLGDQSLVARTSLHVDDIILLLRFCLNQCFFAFRGETYHQVNGCPMGSPVSVSVANLVVELIEEKVLRKVAFPVKFYHRYVDDTFVILDKGHANDFHRELNSVPPPPPIQFPCEAEQQGKLPFLDVCVMRTGEPNHRIETGVYHKPCETDNFLDFLFHYPVQHKKSVVRSFVRRSNTSPPNELHGTNEMTHLREALTKRH
ncbi:unnamed protein product, partial [Ixodes persulcatus]